MLRNIASVITALAAAGAVAVSIYNIAKIGEVHMLINSRMTELLEVTRAASKAEGVKEEKENPK